MRRTWRGPSLTADQVDLAAMLDAFAADHPAPLEDGPGVAQLVTRIAELGIWTLGTAAEHGGGGADQLTTAVALERLGRYWPALGWAAAQAHAAVDLIGEDEPELVAGLHEGRAQVAIVCTASPQVRLSAADGGLAGTIERVDAAGPRPHLLVLDTGRTAYLVDPDAVRSRGLDRTGLGGAFTSALDVQADDTRIRRLHDRDGLLVLGRLWCAAAAVAAGIAGEAADGAAAYAAERRQFGDALTAIATVRQSLLSQVAGTMSAVATSVAADPTQIAQAYAAVSASCDGAIDVAAAALQSHGGYGYLTEYPAERHLRDAVSLRAAVDLPTAARLSADALTRRPSAPPALGPTS